MRWTAAVIVVLALAAGLWWLEQQRQIDLHRSVEPPVVIEPMPEPRYPLPEPEPEAGPLQSTPPAAPPPSGEPASEPDAEAASEPPTPLPELTESDPAALATLTALAGRDFVQRWIKPEFVVPRTVAVINSLDGAAPALRTRPLSTPESEPVTEAREQSDALDWTDANSERYDALMETLESIPPAEAADAYSRHYPLFQQAWEELGETEPYFNDRLIDIIDHLLDTPEVQLPVAVRPYEGRLMFVDQALEDLSWGRKLMVRMGPEHARRAKGWLRDFRRAVVGADRSALDATVGED